MGSSTEAPLIPLNDDPEPELHINDLNDDCLAHIFTFLPYVERTRVERVCKRWNEVGQNNWIQYEKMNTSLEIGTDTGSFPRRLDKLDLKMFHYILLQRGTYLTEISFAESCRNKCTVPGIIEMVVKYCPMIKKIHAENVLLSAEDMVALARCQQIELLGVGCGLNWMDLELRPVFRANKNLRHLTVSRNPSSIGMCLQHLEPNVLETLHIIECPYFHLDESNIRKFTYSLTELVMYYNYDADTLNLSHVSQLKNLRKLKLAGQAWVMEASLISVLHHISRTCLKLDHVEIEDICFMARDDDLGPLFSLPELREIAITGKTNITNQMFVDKTLDKLESLTMPCCWLTEKDYENLANRLPKLKVLKICDCVVRRESKWLRRTRANGIDVVIRFCGNDADRLNAVLSRY